MNSPSNWESPLVVVGFGDSITEGAGASRYDRSWLSVMETLLRSFLQRPCVFRNESLGDNTISPRTTNFEVTSKPPASERTGTVLARQPDLILVCFGLNDMRLGTPVEIFGTDLELIVQRLRAAAPQALLVLTNIFHMTGWRLHPPRDRGSPELACSYNAAISDIASRHGIACADVWNAMGQRDFLIQPDGVHATDLGHRIIAHRVFETLTTKTDFLERQGHAALS